MQCKEQTRVGATGYSGPRPPGNDPHHYHFRIFALDTPLALKPGAERKELLDAMRGHVLAQGEPSRHIPEACGRRRLVSGWAKPVTRLAGITFCFSRLDAAADPCLGSEILRRRSADHLLIVTVICRFFRRGLTVRLSC